MKGIILEAKALIKKKLGLCNTKGCYEKSIEEIKIDCINVKRCLCKKHLELYKELTGKKYKAGIDYGSKEEDKTVITKINGKIKVKSREEKQLESLYKLLMRVKKIRVKKKIRKRIIKLKRNIENNKNRL